LTNPSRPSVVSGEASFAGRPATNAAATLTAFTSRSFAKPGWTAMPVKVRVASRAPNVSSSIVPASEPSIV
jgi:hypothetical protein